MILEEYLDLITSEYRQKINFLAVMSANLATPIQVQELLTAMKDTKFDLDVAVGDQLDIIGQWVGITRDVAIPVTGVFFSWDDPDPNLGWDSGIWQGAVQITQLPDDVYRNLIKAKIAANAWDGTTTGMYEIWAAVFPDAVILVQDNQNMSYDLLLGGNLDALTKALITGGYLPLKPEGVRVNTIFFPFPDLPVFAWDTEGEFLAGWDEGAWATEVAPT